jgi:hypothetical protein
VRTHVFALCLATFLAGCGGDDGGGPPPPAGDPWLGTLEDEFFDLSTVLVRIDGSDITEVRENGVRNGVTGTIGPLLVRVREYTYTVGTSAALNGVFLVNLPGTHMAFADEVANFGVLQKDATSLPGYVYTDLNGNWSTGRSVETDFAGSLFESTSSMTCSIPVTTLICTINLDGGTVLNADFDTSFDPAFGRWQGVFTGPGSTTGDISAFLSPDKTFVAAWACLNPDQFWPEDCIFSAWQR